MNEYINQQNGILNMRPAT